MRIRDRDVGRLLGAAFQRRHWQALRRMYATYEQPGRALRRYATNGGEYPWAPRLRTPLGVVQPLLESYHDLLTVNEIFCRHDYGSADEYRVVVDIGANVGLAALFFATRNPECRVYCFEPDPANLARLEGTLQSCADRVTVIRRAVTAASSSTVRFVPAGRYGHMARDDEAAVELPSVGLDDALAAVLRDVDSIDLLKIDTEGTESDLVAALRAGPHADRVGAVVFEDDTGRTRWLVPVR